MTRKKNTFRKSDLIAVTHTVTLLVRPDPNMSIEDQLHELRSNCESAADYAFGNGFYTQDSGCEIICFSESVTTADTSKA